MYLFLSCFLGPLLSRNFIEAVKYREKQSAILIELSAQFPLEMTQKWYDMVCAWDHGAEFNPYEEKEDGDLFASLLARRYIRTDKVFK